MWRVSNESECTRRFLGSDASSGQTGAKVAESRAPKNVLGSHSSSECSSLEGSESSLEASDALSNCDHTTMRHLAI